jgi:uncharacterized repeat protein (TIGR03809 family)
MTDRTDVARGRDIVSRWSALAEQRLDYLTELYETGRWRRYHSEEDFLDNIREAKAAADTWRAMLDRDGTPDNLPIDLSWIGRRSAVRVPPTAVAAEPAPPAVPEVIELPVAPPVSVVPEIAETEEPVAAEATAEEETALDRTWALTLDIVGMAKRYPLLRNAFQQSGS